MDEKDYLRRLYEVRLTFLKLAGFFVLTMPVVIYAGSFVCAINHLPAPDVELFLKSCFGGIGGMLLLGLPTIPYMLPRKKEEEKIEEKK